MDHVNLFVVGVNKAGTSWLYYLLDGHPAIYMSSEKELLYFGVEYPENLEDYHAHFPFEESYHYFGDASARYCTEERAVHDIHEYAPDAKVLAIVRDPIDRLHSQFYYHKQLGHVREDASVVDLVGPEAAKFRENSRYENLLPPYTEAFGPEQFKVVSLEEGTADLPAFWDELQAFLDVPDAPLPTSGTRPSNATGSKRFRALYRRTIRPVKRNFPTLYRAMLRSDFMSAAKRTLLRLLGTAQKEPIPDEIREQLVEEFQPTYRYLSELGFSHYDEALQAPSQ